MRRAALAAVLLGSAAASAVAQDARDDEIFGSGAAEEPEAPAARPAAPATTPASLLDNLQVGGRLEVRASTANEEHQKLKASGLHQLKQADVYFDARPNKDLRAFLRARFSEQTPAPTAAAQGVQTDLDELWFKTDYADSVFFTYGKQHLKWGSGRFWNPTDFTALETRDPFALFDRRLGQELLKVHVPMEKQGHNFYAVLQLDGAQRNDDIGGALRAELAFGGVGEAALSFQSRRGGPIRYGVDVSSGLGPVDVHAETAVSKRHGRTFYTGGIDAAAGTLPQPYKDEDETFLQTVAGIQYALKYSDDDSVNFGAEYFHNALGYDKRELALYSLVQGDSQALYSGRSYVGAYVRAPSPGSWNDTSFFLNGMRNNVDKTAVARLTATLTVHKDATLEAFVSRCFGDYGELCFRVPESYQVLAGNPALSEEQRARLAVLPTKRALNSGGVGFSASF